MKEEKYKSYWHDKKETIKEVIILTLGVFGFIGYLVALPIGFGLLIEHIFPSAPDTFFNGFCAAIGFFIFDFTLFFILLDYVNWRGLKKAHKTFSVSTKRKEDGEK